MNLFYKQLTPVFYAYIYRLGLEPPDRAYNMAAPVYVLYVMYDVTFTQYIRIYVGSWCKMAAPMPGYAEQSVD